MDLKHVCTLGNNVLFFKKGHKDRRGARRPSRRIWVPNSWVPNQRISHPLHSCLSLVYVFCLAKCCSLNPILSPVRSAMLFFWDKMLHIFSLLTTYTKINRSFSTRAHREDETRISSIIFTFLLWNLLVLFPVWFKEPCWEDLKHLRSCRLRRDLCYS